MPGSEVRPIGSRLEPFVDHYLIGTLADARLVMQRPHPAGVALAFDAPWEGRFSACVTVLHDGDRYLMYYRGKPDAVADGVDEVTCYAESADGITFHKPELGLSSAGGNVILDAAMGSGHKFAPFIDRNPECPLPAGPRSREPGPEGAVGRSEAWLGPCPLVDGQLVPQRQDLQLHGGVSSEGKREQGEEGTDRRHQGGKHRPGGRRAGWMMLLPWALDIALPWPDPQQPRALRVFERDSHEGSTLTAVPGAAVSGAHSPHFPAGAYRLSPLEAEHAAPEPDPLPAMSWHRR